MAVESGPAGQAPLLVGRHVGQRLEQRIVSQGLGVVAVGIAREDLIDLLSQDGFLRVGDELLCPWIGQALGQVSDQAELPLKIPQRQQSCVADHSPAIRASGNLLLADLPEGKLLGTLRPHDLEPPCQAKWYYSCNLD